MVKLKWSLQQLANDVDSNGLANNHVDSEGVLKINCSKFKRSWSKVYAKWPLNAAAPNARLANISRIYSMEPLDPLYSLWFKVIFYKKFTHFCCLLEYVVLFDLQTQIQSSLRQYYQQTVINSSKIHRLRALLHIYIFCYWLQTTHDRCRRKRRKTWRERHQKWITLVWCQLKLEQGVDFIFTISSITEARNAVLIPVLCND